MKKQAGRNKAEALARFPLPPIPVFPFDPVVPLRNKMSHSTERRETRERRGRWQRGNITVFPPKNLARKMLCIRAMSSLENIYKKMAEAAAGAEPPQEAAQKLDSAPHVSPGVAHELNNIIAIIRGYADRLLFKHGENPALEPQLKLISEAAKRAAIIIHDALPRNPAPTARQNPPPAQQPTAP
jgi:C4-dicarboxylate-specific signal transduction histidine kinase